ncbi:NmrA-like family protein [Phyllosticta capitalensis]|uniref:NmrA-like family protein n=1 Tax=Phyllosticta capitalensis TaxID=121624 RepID=A0ABR1YAX2_9PEZI
MSKSILITGATGKQGGATIRALLQSKANFGIIGVTRDPSSASAKELLGLSSNIKVVEGNLDDPTKLLADAKNVAGQPIWGVYSVQVPMGPGETIDPEEKQGKALVDAAIAADVKHFVYSSVERGVDGANNPTPIPHFISKFNIEKHLISEAKKSGMTWTILQPVAFLDNFGPAGSPFAAAFPTMWRMTLGMDKKLQLIATSDIGRMAAKAFTEPEKYAGKTIPLASDELNLKEVQSIFKNRIGMDLPEGSEDMVGGILSRNDDLNKMWKWFGTDGYSVDISKVKEELGGAVVDYKTWLEKESGYIRT